MVAYQQAVATKAAKQRRRHRARQTIAQLGANLNQPLDDHIFRGVPIGGPIQPNAPAGLHAYTNGQLPPHIEHVGIVAGRPDKVHVLRWRHRAPAGAAPYPEKVSTMFPRWMPQAQVRTLIALQYPGTRAAPVAAAGLYPEDARTHITRGAQIDLHMAGNTVYPTHREYNG